MNTKYELGNVIRDSASFANFAFPAELPTEEWKGNEARSYTNYIRPVANLFENDRENNAFIKDLYKGWLNTDNSVVYGCTVVGPITVSGHNYYEVQHGAFVNQGKIYQIYPTCEALAKQIESEYNLNGGNAGELKLKINFNYDTGVYSYSYFSSLETITGTAANAITLVSTLLTAFEITTPIESHIILPILKDIGNTSIYFNGTAIVSGTPITNSTTIATIASGVVSQSTKVSTINGARIEDASIVNSKITNNTITIGSTVVNLGDVTTDFAGVASINTISQGIDQNHQLKIKHTDVINNDDVDTGIAVAQGDMFLLDTACTKEYGTTIASAASAAEDVQLPTSGAVKDYVARVMNGEKNFTGNMTFEDGITIQNSNITSNGKIQISNQTDAGLNNGNLSGNATIYTAGGIEAEKSIYSKGNIVGLNAGTYSKRELKENITDFTEDAVALINGIKIVNYNYKTDADKNHKIGFIADDTHEYFSTVKHNVMDQSNCIGILLAAVQQISAEIKKLSEENKTLKEKSNGTKSKSRKQKVSD